MFAKLNCNENKNAVEEIWPPDYNMMAQADGYKEDYNNLMRT